MKHSLLLAAMLLMPLASLPSAELRPDQSTVPAPKRIDDPRPNLVFVFSDQQSSDKLSCYGNKQVISPNLDRLANQWNCLYDRSTDPAEINNLFASPQQQKVREQLHQTTLNWMQRFGDQGLPYETVIQTVFTAEDLAFRQQKKWHDFTGILKGRPSDLLNQKEESRKMDTTKPLYSK